MLTKRPLPPLTAAFALGILSAATVFPLVWVALVSLLILTLLFAITRRPIWGTGAILSGMFLLGFARYYTCSLLPANDISHIAPASVRVTGVVQSDSGETADTESKKADTAKFTLAVQSVDFGNFDSGNVGTAGTTSGVKEANIGGNIEVRVPLRTQTFGNSTRSSRVDRINTNTFVTRTETGSALREAPHYGDVMRIYGRLTLPEGPRNPGGFDSRATLAQRGIFATLKATKTDDWQIQQSGGIGSLLLRSIYNVRRSILHRSYAAHTRQHAEVLNGILLGERGDLPTSLKLEFERTGTTHMLATAGLHVGMVVILLNALLRLLRITRRPTLLASFGILLIYAVMAGWRPSVVRAAVMASVYLIGLLLEREPDLPNALTLAALILLLLSPFNLFDPGYQMSFAIVLTILLLMPLAKEAIARAEKWYPDYRPGAKPIRAGVKLVAGCIFLALAAQIGAFPLVAYYFHTVSFVGINANTLAVPALLLIIALGFTAALLGAFSPLLALPLDWLLEGLLAYILWIIRHWAALPFASLNAVAPPVPLVLLYYAVLWALAWRWSQQSVAPNREQEKAEAGGKKSTENPEEKDAFATSGEGMNSGMKTAQKRSASPVTKFLGLYIGISLLMLVWVELIPHRPHELKITFLDVGQGDAAVIETPSGKVVIIDTGNIGQDNGDDLGQRVVAPFLQQEGINHIDALLLTHPHADHIGGAETLLHQISTGLLMDNGQETGSSLVTHYLTEAHDRQVTYQAAKRGQEIDCHDGVRIHVLAPIPAEMGLLPNDASLVIRVDYEHTSFVMTGDAEAVEEQELVDSGVLAGCTVLKVGHHGSRTSTNADFLTAIHPKIAIISVGAHNVYQHPSLEVVARLQDSGAAVYRTDRNGAVTCVSNGVTIQTTPMDPSR